MTRNEWQMRLLSRRYGSARYRMALEVMLGLEAGEEMVVMPQREQQEAVLRKHGLVYERLVAALDDLAVLDAPRVVDREGFGKAFEAMATAHGVTVEKGWTAFYANVQQLFLTWSQGVTVTREQLENTIEVNLPTTILQALRTNIKASLTQDILSLLTPAPPKTWCKADCPNPWRWSADLRWKRWDIGTGLLSIPVAMTTKFCDTCGAARPR